MRSGDGPSSADDPVPWLTSDERSTWLALHRVTMLLPGALDRQLRESSSLSFVEYYVLVMLSEHVDRTVGMSRLAVLVDSELSRLSHLVGRLERRGLVRREPDPNDRRCTNAILTDAGLTHLQAAAPEHVRTVRRLVFDVLEPAQQHAMRKALRRILSNLDD
jgi:DNA-binding MarR family transcriptional regulator